MSFSDPALSSTRLVSVNEVSSITNGNTNTRNINPLFKGITNGCCDYLNSLNVNSSGVYSGLVSYMQGNTGRQRVERVLQILSDEHLMRKNKCLEYLFYSILISGSKVLSKYVIDNVSILGIYSRELTPLIDKYSDVEYSANGNNKIKFCFLHMLRHKLGITGSTDNIDTNKDYNKLAGYLDGNVLLSSLASSTDASTPSASSASAASLGSGSGSGGNNACLYREFFKWL
jgi:hypothetical protein